MKAASDLLHLWHGRRGYVRIKAQLTAAIYDKALRRKDASGVIDNKKEDDDKKDDDKKDDDKKDGAKNDKKDGQKAAKTSNADTGKVVNLMSTDVSR
jgi:hypothetical protein